ncbi:MAG: DUF1684 domain-containing protein [Bacteroidia bacterium]|nr:DUF1684 domain-containing protein [Bacteroidia bacterium]MDW8235754.1 DUF1684 domain-containing protein [Bacteroidia bacterium]
MRKWGWQLIVVGAVIGILLLLPRRTTKSAPFLQGLCQKGWYQYAALLEEARRGKDSIFRTAAHSPIPEAERGYFSGLKYFPIDSTWRLRGRYEPTPNALAPVIGKVLLNLPGLPSCQAPHSMVVYDGKGELPYIAFWDSTAMEGLTYEGGRYVPIVVEGDSACVDFNRAYFPYCAYNPNYICLPYPPENRLCISVYAGERR